MPAPIDHYFNQIPKFGLMDHYHDHLWRPVETRRPETRLLGFKCKWCKSFVFVDSMDEFLSFDVQSGIPQCRYLRKLKKKCLVQRGETKWVQ